MCKNIPTMEEKELRVIEASLNLYRRHGFQKVTMSDIAQALGVSRPTLYALFPNKQAIFGKYVSSHFNQMDKETERRLKAATSLKDRLTAIFDIWVIWPVSEAIGSEEGRDIIANCEVYAPDAVAEMYDRIERYLYQAIKQEAGDSGKVRDTVHTLKVTAKALKSGTTDLAELKRLAKTLVLMTVALYRKG